MILNGATCPDEGDYLITPLRSLMKVLTWAVNVAGGLVFLHSAVAIASEISVPQWGDKYSKSVKELEAGKTAINYREFRESFLESKQFRVATSSSEEIDRLEASIPDLIKNKRYTDLIDLTKRILSIDYTEMRAHKYLYQTYKVVGDEANRAKYHDIEIGLLKSIVKNDDGNSCANAWPVVQVREEYFVLEMIGATLKQQGIDTNGGLCDRMEVTTDEGDRVYYFDTTKVFESYKRLGLK